MKVTFVTTQAPHQSSIIGRILPLASRLQAQHGHTVHILGHKEQGDGAANPSNFQIIGANPFTSGPNGKQHHSGLKLIWQMLTNTWRTFQALNQLSPDIAIISKPLPQNTLAVLLWQRWQTLRFPHTKRKIILDVDDYELTANTLSSIAQRAAVHWSERTACSISDTIITASPFLEEYVRQLTPRHRNVSMIPTSIELPPEISKTLPQTRTLLYIGSISQASGHRVDLLPDIITNVKQSYPDLKLRIAGSGDDTGQLKAAFEQMGLGDTVEWTGRFTTDTLPSLLKDAAMIIDPIDASITNRAKSSFRVALAAFSGLPVVTSDIGLRRYWLSKSLHHRLLATPGDPAAYADHISDLLDKPLSREESASLKQQAQPYHWDKLASRYHQIITS